MWRYENFILLMSLKWGASVLKKNESYIDKDSE